MPYPMSMLGKASTSGHSKRWQTVPGIPIFLETHDERAAPKSYGTTPTTPTTPDIVVQSQTPPSGQFGQGVPDSGSIQHSPHTTIQTSSTHSSVWSMPGPTPKVQQQQESSRPALRFFPTQRPRIQLGIVPTLQIPQMPHIPQINEKTPINYYHPGLGIAHGGEKPPFVEITPPDDDKIEEDSPGLAERIEQRLFQYSISGNVVKRWLLELISWIFSALCMGAIVGVLIYLQDDKLSNWTLDKRTGLTLNAYISILSKMAGASLILPVSEALGQLKWSWFLQHSKQMWDFEIFDNASRGPWGAFLLLIRTKGRALAALGALITLGLLILDPFFQQVVDFPDRWTLQDAAASVPLIQRFESGEIAVYTEGGQYAIADRDISLVASDFFYGNGTQPIPFGNGTRPDIPLSCPTSNCTWPAYDTLGVCSECADISSYLTYACVNGTVDWTSNLTGGYNVDESYPNGTMCGYFLDPMDSRTVMMSGYVLEANSSKPGEALLVRTMPMVSVYDKIPVFGNGSIMFSDVRDPIADVLIVSAADGTASSVYRHEAPIAQECVISWCVKTIKSSYDWGTYHEQVLQTYINKTEGAYPWQTIDYTSPSGATIGTEIFYADDIHITVDSMSAGHKTMNYGTSNNTAYSIMMVFDDMFPSFYTVKDESSDPILRFWTWKDGPAYTQYLNYNPWLAPNNISAHVGRLATALTNVIRSTADKKWLEGDAYSMENYVAVRWEWLTLPLSLLMMSLIFLAATVFKSAHEREQVGVLKNSAILTLLHGIPDDMRGRLTRSTSVGTPRAKAKELKVRLHPNLGWRLSGNVFSPLTSRIPKAQPPPGWI